ncbi:MAG: hypothetical protein VB071_14435 [Lawsonibacter sp.]|nr:hypothetical protein [Lawsonibacter sp.]
MIDSIALIGLLLALAALWVWNWKMLQVVERHEKAILELRARLNYRPKPEESRCQICKDRRTCPAAFTGVIFPCRHFRDEREVGSYGPEK